MKEGVESLGRVRAQAMVLLVIAFLAGAFVGGTIERAMARPSRSSMGLGPRGGFARGGTSMARTPRAPGSLPSWYEPLNLTVDQRAKIEAILTKRSARVDSAMKSACVVIGPARDSSTKEADAVLTPDQRAKRDSIRGARPMPSRMGGASRGMFGCGPMSAQPAGKK